MYYTNFDKVLESIFESNSPVWENKSTTFVPSKFAVDVKDDKAHIALAVIGHDLKKQLRYKLQFIMHWADHMSTIIERQDNVI